MSSLDALNYIQSSLLCDLKPCFLAAHWKRRTARLTNLNSFLYFDHWCDFHDAHCNPSYVNTLNCYVWTIAGHQYHAHHRWRCATVHRSSQLACCANSRLGFFNIRSSGLCYFQFYLCIRNVWHGSCDVLCQAEGCSDHRVPLSLPSCMHCFLLFLLLLLFICKGNIRASIRQSDRYMLCSNSSKRNYFLDIVWSYQ